MKKILLFTDPGVDDAFAIMYALLHPELELVGLVCGYGNVSQSDALRNSAYLLKLAGRDDIPLINGAKAPLSGQPPQYFYDLHGYHGIGAVNTESTKITHTYPFHTVYELITVYGSELTLVNLSRLTTLALTFLEAESNIHDVKEIIIMGGAFFVPGNISPLAEANIYGDPPAGKIVTTYGKNLTFLPLNVSNRSIISNDIIRYLSNQTTTPFTPIIKPIMDYYSSQYQHIMPGINGGPLHDVAALSCLTSKDHYKGVNRQVFVVDDGSSKGLTYADFRPVPKVEPGYPINKIILDFSVQHFVNDFVAVMSGSLIN
ncbi:purine nucleosidase [Scopulibacillus darangshiensis]|uniref:Purine nucleosidase n=1 Tax=Scopulibacillus darangshiensis TaxID=442528 RepID=A0A4R2P4G3_9BACL|nr:nucleoside hydrolase [Scopulibacillus darangshiensis]TCP29633.1 purine nucleosidase [Scopulibacillus darangshiensis]